MTNVPFIMPDATSPTLGTNAGAIKKRLVDESGRFDLVVDAENDDYTDAGAFNIINAAHQWMDGYFQFAKSHAWFYVALAQGQMVVTFKQARIIKEVWLADGANDRVQLGKKSLSVFRKEFARPMAQLTQGQPVCYAPAVLGLAPEQLGENAASFDAAGIEDHGLIEFGSDHLVLRGIVVGPPADKAYTIQVLGEWGSQKIDADTDVTFWTANHEDLLLKAARRELEIGSRNRTGVSDWEAVLIPDLQRLHRDIVAESVRIPASSAVMEG